VEVLVTGGTGWFGRPAVRLLVERGHRARVVTRRERPDLPEGATAARVDLEAGAGLEEAAAGAELVLHAASDPRTRRGAVDVEMTRRVVDAARAAGARRVLYVSIVGIDRIPFAYYRHKLECERVLEASGLPYTILRATQFHELAEWALRRFERLPLAPLPFDWRFQPIAAADAAREAVDLLERPPDEPLVERGGPEVLAVRELVDVWRAKRGRPRRVVGVRYPGGLSRGFREGRNTVPEHAVDGQQWRDFVAALPD
jgi:uncharacterized protein YbjT (DUF2867 family)